MNTGKESLPGYTQVANQLLSSELIAPSTSAVVLRINIPVPADQDFTATPFLLREKYFDPVAAERQQDALMGKRFSDWFLGRNTVDIPDDVASWLFYKLTGYNIEGEEKYTSSSRTATEMVQPAVGVEYPSRVIFPKIVEPEFKLDQADEEALEKNGWDPEEVKPYFEKWKAPVLSQLQILIGKSKENPNALLMGGGLPPSEKIMGAYKIMRKAYNWADRHYKYENKVAYVDRLLQYPATPGGAKEHRESVIDIHLNETERSHIINAYGDENRSNGLFFTNGSQEALHLMCKSVATQFQATAENPVEIAVMDPVYPGFLMAAKEFLEEGTLKLRIIPMDKKGNIDIDSLNQALSNDRCKTVYFSEGNPQPTAIANFDEVVEALRAKEREVLVFEDRAYKGLSEGEEKSLFEQLPEMVIGIQTFSKMFAPGIRLGYLFAGSKNNILVRDTMLTLQYNRNLGVSGHATGTMSAILEYDRFTAQTDPEHKGKFTRHKEGVKEYYHKRKEMYKTWYQKALDIAYGAGNYDIDDEVVTGIGMFGWRKTPVDSYSYADLGTKIGLFSLPGGECIPKQDQIAGDTQIADSSSQKRMRQNFTWIGEERLPLAVVVDVLLGVTLRNDIPVTEKEQTLRKLYSLAKRLNKNKDIPELKGFIDYSGAQ